MKKLALISLCSFLSAFLGIISYAYLFPLHVEVQEAQIAQEVKNEILFSNRLNGAFETSAPNNFIDAANSCVESVVFISSRKTVDGPNKFTRRVNASTGSGVIISKDGYIVTNYHVIEDAVSIEVLLNDNREYEAKLIGSDPTTDLALLKIQGNNLPFIVIGNSDSLQVGEWVLAVGNPFRLQSTVTAGIVSAKARNINILSRQGIESFIQTDAAVNPGNSGGALVNTQGYLVGVNAAIMSNSGQYEGYSFAIPANLAKKVIYDLKEYGAVQRGWMGITIVNVDADKAKELGVREIEGVYLEMVSKDGAAQQGGLKRNDILIAVNGRQTSSVPEFMEQIAAFRPGDLVSVDYYRNGTKATAQVTLRNQLNTTDFIAVRRDKILADLGFELRDMDSAEQEQFQSKGAVVVSIYKNSTIKETNMELGYIITKVNDQKVNSAKDLISYLQNNKGKIFLEGFYEKYPGAYPYSFINK